MQIIGKNNRMKHKLLLTTFFVFVSSVSFAQRMPNWVTNKPTPTNDTYLYVVESAFGSTEIEARNQAIARVFQSTAMRIGQPINSDEINRAVQSGTAFDVISRQYNIPINKVCEYVENKSGMYSVYILCQVAKAGNTPVRFDEFNDCYKSANQYYAAEALAPVGFKIYRDGIRLRDTEIRTLFANSKSYDLYDRGIRLEKIGDPFWGIGVGAGLIGAFFYGVACIDDEGDLTGMKKFGGYTFVAGGIGIVSGLVINAIGKSQIRKAVNLYNNGKMYSYNSIEMEYGITMNGAYLTFRF